jgi:Ca-activated chloride channel family protein
MAALDMDGKSRFEKSVQLILQFAHNRPTDSIGLAAVGNDAALLVPPTTDRQALHTRLEQLRVAELGDGTALGNGLAVAAYHLEKSEANRKIVILITDGENNAGAIHPETAASALRDICSFWVIGVGSGGEVPIDYIDPATRMRRTGIFDSHFNSDSLRRISLSGGGTYIPAQSAEAFAAAVAGIDEREMFIRIPGNIEKRQSVLVPVLVSAFTALVVCRFIRRVILGAWQ